MGSCSLLFDALRSSSRAGAIRLQRKTWPLRSRSKLSEGLGAASAGVITRGCPAVHWHIDFLVALPSAQDLLLCAKHLFVAAMVAWVHPGPAEIGKSEHDGGACVTFSGAAKAKRHRPYPWYPPFIGRSNVLINRECRARKLRRSSAAVATSREGHRSLRSVRAGQHLRLGQGRELSGRPNRLFRFLHANRQHPRSDQVAPAASQHDRGPA